MKVRIFLFAVSLANCIFVGFLLDALLSPPLAPTEYLVIGWCAAMMSAMGAAGSAIAAVRTR